MLGILVILLLSWGLLYWIEQKSILALGFLPVPQRIKQFALGLLISALLCVSLMCLEMLLSGAHFLRNESFGLSQLGAMLWWDTKSVFTEELIFRGALLYILIARLGTRKGVLLSAIAFGIYHWFSYGLWGNIVPMVVVFIGTGLAGYAWALAFAKTRSMLLPFGLHLGWNFTFNTIFSKGPLGKGLFLMEGGHALSSWFSLLGLWAVPILTLLFVIYGVPQEKNTAPAQR